MKTFKKYWQFIALAALMFVWLLAEMATRDSLFSMFYYYRGGYCMEFSPSSPYAGWIPTLFSMAALVSLTMKGLKQKLAAYISGGIAAVLALVSMILIFTFNSYEDPTFANVLVGILNFIIPTAVLALTLFDVIKNRAFSAIGFLAPGSILFMFTTIVALAEDHFFFAFGLAAAAPLWLLAVAAVTPFERLSLASEPEKETRVQNAPPTKSKLTAILFAIFFGGLGVDRFYLGYTLLGVIKLLTMGGFGIWTIVDLILICTGSLRPADGSDWKLDTPAAQPQVQPAQPAPQPETNVFEALERLAKLHDAGALTDEEFAQKKAEMLSKL